MMGSDLPFNHECPECRDERYPPASCEKADRETRKAYWSDVHRQDREAMEIVRAEMTWMDPMTDGGVRKAIERVLGLASMKYIQHHTFSLGRR